MVTPSSVPVPWGTREEVYARCDWSCFYCGVEAQWDSVSSAMTGLTIDHVVPRSLGGSNDSWNLVAACLSCNAMKGAARPPIELISWARDLFDADPDPDVRVPMWRTTDALRVGHDFEVGQHIVISRALFARMESGPGRDLVGIFSEIRKELGDG